jgi:hypothetical protein
MQPGGTRTISIALTPRRPVVPSQAAPSIMSYDVPFLDVSPANRLDFLRAKPRPAAFMPRGATDRLGHHTLCGRRADGPFVRGARVARDLKHAAERLPQGKRIKVGSPTRPQFLIGCHGRLMPPQTSQNLDVG